MIEIFLPEGDKEKRSDAVPGKVLAFRARMRELAGHQKLALKAPIKTSDLAKTGTAKTLYWIVGFAASGAVAVHAKRMVAAIWPKHEMLAANVLWGLTAVLSLMAMIVLWRGLNKSLLRLVEAKPGSGHSKSAYITGYISTAFVIGIILILALLVFDYQSHSAAGVLNEKKQHAATEISSRDNSLWRISPSPQSTVEVKSDFAADFGSFAGTFGDFFGGVLNPILTFGTLIGLAVTILMQRTQLLDEKQRADDTARVSNHQTFETTFFNLLNLHNATISDLHFVPSSVKLPSAESNPVPPKNDAPQDALDYEASIVIGRAVFASVLDTMNQLSKDPDAGNYLNNLYFSLTGAYKLIQDKHNHVLGHYFRNLYQILAFVDRYITPIESEELDVEYLARKRYTNILRAQLSAHELSLLLFNCHAQMVDQGAFRSLLIEYQFLEHVPFKYSYLHHKLYIEGYDDPINPIVDQYLGSDDVGVSRSGAFGDNPAVFAFLRLRSLLRLN
jgi:hypothetical protein